MKIGLPVTVTVVIIISLVIHGIGLPMPWESILVGISIGFIIYISKNIKMFEKEVSFKVGFSIIIFIPMIIILCMYGCRQTATVGIEDLSYNEIINHQYYIVSPKTKVAEILLKKVMNENEAIVFFLNKEHTISLARIVKVNNRGRAFVSVPPNRVGNEPISWNWSLLCNTSIEDNTQLASVMWGYIYSPEVAKVYVGSQEKENLLQEAQILNFDKYNIKLYYFLSNDKIGFKENTVVAYDHSGDILFSNRR